MGMGPSFVPKTQPSQIAARAYTDDFAAILVESPPGPRSMPVKARHAVRCRHKPTDNAWRQAAPLCGLLLLSAIAASWYAIVDPVWSTPITIPGSATILPLTRPLDTAGFRPIEDGKLPIDAELTTAAADDWALAAIESPLSRPSETGVVAAKPDIPPQPQTKRKPVPNLVASLVESPPNAPTSAQRVPRGATGLRTDDVEKPVSVRNGESKERKASPLFDFEAVKPQSSWPNIFTASRVGTVDSSSESQQSNGSAKAPGATSNAIAESQDAQPADGPRGDKSKPEKADKAKSVGSSVIGDKDRKPTKDKPAASNGASKNKSGKGHAGKTDKSGSGKSDASKKGKSEDVGKKGGKGDAGKNDRGNSGKDASKRDKSKDGKGDAGKNDKSKGGKGDAGKNDKSKGGKGNGHENGKSNRRGG